MINIVLFGPPGAGKGTQSDLLIEKYGLCHISTGDLFRKHLREETDLGKKAKGFMDAGNLVPDEIVIGMVDEKVREVGKVKGFIFDGFPRTVNQAEALDKMLDKHGYQIDCMLSLDVPDEELRKRLTERAKTSGRVDDQDPEKINNRIKVYYNETQPVIDYYKQQNKHARIDGVGKIEEIFQSLCAEIEKIS